MANVKLMFYGTEKSETDENKLECFLNTSNDIFICISMEGFVDSYVCLDKSTAIKFAKTLRTEINKMEVEDGNR